MSGGSVATEASLLSKNIEKANKSELIASVYL